MAPLREKAKLLRGLLSGSTAYAGPFYATVDVTRRCNLRCPGCRYHSSVMETMPSAGGQEARDLPLGLFQQVCAELQLLGTSAVLLSGEGEPLLHPHIIDMVTTAKDADLHVRLNTNGTLLNRAWAQSLVDARLDVLRVSMWGSSREEYERNYPGSDPGSFDKIIDGLHQLSEAKAARGSRLPTVGLHQPINRNNFQTIETMIDLAQATGCGMLSFSPFKTRRGELSSMALSPDEESQVRHMLSRMAGRLSSLRIKHNIDKTLLRYRLGEAVWQELPCYNGWLHVHIKGGGVVVICSGCDIPMGNLNEQTLQDIWNGAALQEFRRQTSTCVGLSGLGERCDCGFCCHTEGNWRVHQLFRWLRPLSVQSSKE